MAPVLRFPFSHLYDLVDMATLPTQSIAGVEVPDTPLISKALGLCRKHLDDWAYNHCMRAWLFGFIIADNTPQLQDRDREVHSIAAILHDLGWDETGDFISQDKRFEVGTHCLPMSLTTRFFRSFDQRTYVRRY